MLSPAQAHLVGLAWAGLGLGPGLYTDIGVLGVHPAYLGIASEIRQLTASSWLLHYAKAWWASFFSF